MNDNIKRLMRRLNYQFKDVSLLLLALTHCSVSDKNYERFEFLGDSILSFVMADKLLNLYPDYPEGKLSRLRSYLVKGDTLAEIAQELDLGQCLILGQGELKSGGFRRASILADSFEAILAAIYHDGGLECVRQVILGLYESRLNTKDLLSHTKDYKTQLQELLQSKKLDLPQYKLDSVEGESHQQTFYVSCKVASLNLHSEAKGSTRRKAEQAAAAKLLKKL